MPDGLRNEILVGDVLDRIKEIPDESVQCCVTSPPYWGLRAYMKEGHPDKAKEIGVEPSLQEYIEKMVLVFREVRRVLKKKGTLWLNLGDSYATVPCGRFNEGSAILAGRNLDGHRRSGEVNKVKASGLKSKDLIGLPWRVAFALQDDGWWIRSENIWHKTAILPDSATDRTTRSHETVFHLSRSERYFYDQEAVREPFAESTKNPIGEGRNRRSVWTISPKPYPEVHFAVFPPELPIVCIKAGTKKGDIVLDPFAGAGTTLMTAYQLGRDFIGIELNPEYAQLARERVGSGAALREHKDVFDAFGL